MRLPLPIHHDQPCSSYNAPGCHCRATCASLHMTLLAPQINSAKFLDCHGALGYVPGREPGYWDWRYANPVGIGHPLFEASDLIADFLRNAHSGLLPPIHLL
ncbi:hypothetical protein [Micromonospora sp. NPDC000018]|uniref:hypothetical protein n=1 Tax=Micromonospora sp. NPDC000018 TaxID=3154239 RepID=UPI00332F5522